jgi:beta-lactamase regulating signal transducer with metallopeptidase domain
MLTYLLELTVCWTLLYGVFYLCMRRETFFKINRWYLLSAILLGLVIPLLRFIPIMEEVELYNRQIAEYAPIVYVIKDAPAIVAQSISEQSIEWGQVFQFALLVLYTLGFAFFLFRFIKGLKSISRLYQEGEKTIHQKHTLINTSGNHLPFSFLNIIYISKDLPINEDYNRIITHELEHVRSWHRVDVLLLEIINIVFWFHPIIYLYKSALRQTHEYLADAAVCGNDSRQHYGQLLLRQSLSGLEIALAHHFFHSHIKKRINMIYQEKSGRKAWLKYALAVPALALLMLVFTSHNTIEDPVKRDISIYNDIPVIYNSPESPKFNFFLEDEFQKVYKGIELYMNLEGKQCFSFYIRDESSFLNLFKPEGFLLSKDSKEFHLYQNDDNDWLVKYKSQNLGDVKFIVLDNDNNKIKELSIQKNKQTLIFPLSDLNISVPIFQIRVEQGGERLDMDMVSFHNPQALNISTPSQDDFEVNFGKNPSKVSEKKIAKEAKHILEKEISDDEKIVQLETLYKKWLTKYPKESLRIRNIISYAGPIKRRMAGFINDGKLILSTPFYHLPGTPDLMTEAHKIELSNMLMPSYEELEEGLERFYETKELTFLHQYLTWQGYFYLNKEARSEARRLFEKYAQTTT